MQYIDYFQHSTPVGTSTCIDMYNIYSSTHIHNYNIMMMLMNALRIHTNVMSMLSASTHINPISVNVRTGTGATENIVMVGLCTPNRHMWLLSRVCFQTSSGKCRKHEIIMEL